MKAPKRSRLSQSKLSEVLLPSLPMVKVTEGMMLKVSATFPTLMQHRKTSTLPEQ